MAKFLTTAGTSYQVENILISAKRQLGLISPYLQLSPILSQRLKEASERGVKIVVIYGKNELKPKEQAVLEGLPNLSLYYLENLHAKCYFNETSMVVTSMNLYEFSEKNNREMGIFIEFAADKELYKEAFAECRSIFKAAQLKFPLQPLPVNPQEQQEQVVQSTASELPTKGFCIRCGVDLPFNPTKPLCKKCFSSWAEWEDEDYREKCCHCCGKENRTSMAKPLCYSCYKEFAKG